MNMKNRMLMNLEFVKTLVAKIVNFYLALML